MCVCSSDTGVDFASTVVPRSHLLSAPFSTEVQKQFSRYYNEFSELQLLGKGAFGAVIKVRRLLSLCLTDSDSLIIHILIMCLLHPAIICETWETGLGACDVFSDSIRNWKKLYLIFCYIVIWKTTAFFSRWFEKLCLGRIHLYDGGFVGVCIRIKKKNHFQLRLL